MLALAAKPDWPCGVVDDLVDNQFYEVERKIADLQRSREELDPLPTSVAAVGHMADCRIIEALSP